MRLLDLFSGIGGFSLAAAWAGIETVAFCENNLFRQKVLRKNFPGVPIFNDIKTLKRGDIDGAVDIVSGGVPCQPSSLAGKRRGKADDRWLWPEMLRCIKEFRPTWCIVENVAGFVSTCADDLENEGFGVQAFLIPACGVGSPQLRERIWILAYSDRNRLQGSVQERAEKTDSVGGLGGRSGMGAVSVLRRVLVQHTRNARFRVRLPTDRGVGDGPIRSERWQREPGVGRVAYGISHRVDRVKALGNAIVPQIAYEIMSKILEVA